MKVQAADNAKVINLSDDQIEEIGPQPGSFNGRISNSAYMNFSKNLLLFLTILASLLACIVFARDLMGHNSFQSAYPRQEHLTASESTAEPIQPEDVFDDLFPEIFGNEGDGKKVDDGKVFSETGHITFRLRPLEPKQTEVNVIKEFNPSTSDKEPFPFLDIANVIMDMMDQVLPTVQSKIEEQQFSKDPFSFGDRSISPKIIIFKSSKPLFFGSSKDEDFIFNEPEKIADSKPESNLSGLTLQSNQMWNDPMDLFFAKVASDLISQPQMVQIEDILLKNVDKVKEYQQLLSRVSDYILKLMEEIKSFQNIIQKQMDGLANDVKITEDKNNSNSKDDFLREFYMNLYEQTNEFRSVLSKALSLNDAEKTALETASTDQKELKKMMDTYMEGITSYLNALLSAASELAPRVDNERTISKEILETCTKLCTDMIDLGNLVYQDMRDLRNSLEDSVNETKDKVDEETKEKIPNDFIKLPLEEVFGLQPNETVIVNSQSNQKASEEPLIKSSLIVC